MTLDLFLVTDFLNVLYATDINDTLNPDNISMRENDNAVGVLIKDEQLGNVSVTMPKTGKPEVKVSITAEQETGCETYQL